MSDYRPAVGETVMLQDTGNDRSDGQFGKVKELADGYAVLETMFGSREYRAAWSEMVPIVRPVSAGLSRNGAAHQKNGAARSTVRGAGYNGPPCSNCQGLNFSPAGACWKCEDCGESSGCS